MGEGSDGSVTPIEMARFFDERASSYDEHMRRSVVGFERFYSEVSAPLGRTDEKIAVLDLGCGTGLELEGIIRRAPNAHVTCVDVSQQMLSELRRKYAELLGQIALMNASYEEVCFPEKQFDYAVSVMSFHHYLHDRKRRLYERIRRWLKDGGIYIEGDYVVSPEKEREFLRAYEIMLESGKVSEQVLYHVDIPFSVETQVRLFLAAGFKTVDLLWQEGKAAILAAHV